MDVVEEEILLPGGVPAVVDAGRVDADRFVPEGLAILASEPSAGEG